MPRKNKRNQTKHPNLEPKLNLKTRYDLFDQDYINKLSPEDKKWLDDFNGEYINGDFNRKNPKKNLHKKKKYIKEADDRNNARNRCILTRAKASHQLMSYEDLDEEINDYEDKLINEIDKKDVRNAIEWLADELDKDENTLEKRLIEDLKEEES